LGIAILLVCIVGDYISTLVLISMGAHELNPFLSAVGVLPAKLLAVGLVIPYLYLYQHVPNFHKSPYAVVILTMWAAPLMSNTLLILSKLL